MKISGPPIRSGCHVPCPECGRGYLYIASSRQVAAGKQERLVYCSRRHLPSSSRCDFRYVYRISRASITPKRRRRGKTSN